MDMQPSEMKTKAYNEMTSKQLSDYVKQLDIKT